MAEESTPLALPNRPPDPPRSQLNRSDALTVDQSNVNFRAQRWIGPTDHLWPALDQSTQGRPNRPMSTAD
ncbi:hypothetical protein Sm713_69610 [Streptomyces sp. TS71-3]|nr:hypothetical protein Sm713_69610 [Streptomyces sp. TS71-3]